MIITAKSGKTFEAEWVLETETRNGIQQLAIQFPGGTDPAEAIAELVGMSQIHGTNDKGNHTVYEGYSFFKSLIASDEKAALRLTLERGASNG